MRESPIFSRTYDLLQWMLRATMNYPRSQRFVLAKRVQDTAFDLQEALIEAGLSAKEQRLGALHDADMALAKLRFHIRLSHDMGWLSLSQYEHVARMTDEVGRLLGGWLRKERGQQRPP